MTRQIKLRALDTIQEKILPVELIDFRNDLISINEEDNSVTDTSEMFILLQYTGLKDKNGIEIYEGNFVTNKSKSFSGNGFRGKNLKMLVHWDQDECCYKLIIQSDSMFGFKRLTKASAKDVEVIN